MMPPPAKGIEPQRGSMPVLQFCMPAQLQVDASYQRPTDAKASRTLINQIARGWDWRLYQPLVVARRADGNLYVVDGQHRLEADQETWLGRFREGATARDCGAQLAAKEVLAAAYAEAGAT